MEEEREYVVVAPNEVLVRGSSWTDGQVLGSLVRGDSFWATGPTVDQDGGRRRVPIRWELPTPRSSRAEDGSSAWDVARNAHNAWVTEVTHGCRGIIVEAIAHVVVTSTKFAKTKAVVVHYTLP